MDGPNTYVPIIDIALIHICMLTMVVTPLYMMIGCICMHQLGHNFRKKARRHTSDIPVAFAFRVSFYNRDFTDELKNQKTCVITLN